jgi:hypothetical protein
VSGTQIGTSNVLATRIDNTSNYVSYLTYAASTPLHLSAEPKEQEDAEDVRVCISLKLFFSVSPHLLAESKEQEDSEDVRVFIFFFRLARASAGERALIEP